MNLIMQKNGDNPEFLLTATSFSLNLCSVMVIIVGISFEVWIRKRFLNLNLYCRENSRLM
jgi:hypothetical protein